MYTLVIKWIDGRETHSLVRGEEVSDGKLRVTHAHVTDYDLTVTFSDGSTHFIPLTGEELRPGDLSQPMRATHAKLVKGNLIAS